MSTGRRHSAFTIGELSAVLAATSFVAALAYSTYRTYAVREEVSAGIALANSRVLLRPLGNIITICPPLNLESEHIDEIVAALEDGLKALDEPA
jgi:adenosylmethionine-8-amino-7-oxononanoate aminotransferase